MSRRHSAVKRVVLPDAKYNDQVVAKFINNVMEQGKKAVAEKSFIPLSTLWLRSLSRKL